MNTLNNEHILPPSTVICDKVLTAETWQLHSCSTVAKHWSVRLRLWSKKKKKEEQVKLKRLLFSTYQLSCFYTAHIHMLISAGKRSPQQTWRTKGENFTLSNAKFYFSKFVFIWKIISDRKRNDSKLWDLMNQSSQNVDLFWFLLCVYKVINPVFILILLAKYNEFFFSPIMSNFISFAVRKVLPYLQSDSEVLEQCNFASVH